MIPKIIHYCWFGGNSKSELIQKCIESWKKHCPEYEIIEWNENNFDVNMFDYTKVAYRDKKWAFVSDVARLYAVYNLGGIYMDTDVELKAPLDEFLKHKAYFAFESELYVNTGKSFGAEKGCDLVKNMMNDYSDRSLYNVDGRIDELCTHINTKFLEDSIPKFICNNSYQEIDGVVFYPYERIDQYLKHYNSLSWADNRPVNQCEHKKIVKSILKKFRRADYIKWVERHLGNGCKKIYVFCVYDLFDTGISYYLNSLKKKIKSKFIKEII